MYGDIHSNIYVYLNIFKHGSYQDLLGFFLSSSHPSFISPHPFNHPIVKSSILQSQDYDMVRLRPLVTQLCGPVQD